MTVRVGINGFGRIGRNFVRSVLRQAELDPRQEWPPCCAATDATAQAGFVFHFYLLTDQRVSGKTCTAHCRN